jgi:hypothetical protein
MDLVTVFTSLPDTKAKKDDDISDRLSSRYTVVILVVFAIVVSASQYVGTPIVCWVPVHFTGSHTKYTNSYCWVRNTYYLPYQEHIPKEHEDKQTIPYYQWVPFILLSQAILFYLPSIIWHGLNQKAGVDADNILAAANTFNRTDKVESRGDTLKLIVNQMDRFLGSKGYKNMEKSQYGWQGRFKKAMNILCCNMCGRRFGSYLTSLYLFSKLAYIANVVGQLYLLNLILATEYNLYGFEVLRWLMTSNHAQWMHSPYTAFPRVTMCDFKVRRLGNIHRYTVQCTLPINLYNEKIYMFLWFWMVFVACFTVYSFITWFIKALFFRDRVNFVRAYIQGPDDRVSKRHMVDTLDKDTTDREIQAFKEDIEEFVGQYLLQDGVFLLRLIEHNTNDITVQEIAEAIFKKWYDRKNTHKPTLDEPDTPEKKPLFDEDEASV